MAKHDTLFIGIELPQKLKAGIIVFCMAGLKIIGDSTHLVLACCLKRSGRGKALVGILEEALILSRVSNRGADINLGQCSCPNIRS